MRILQYTILTVIVAAATGTTWWMATQPVSLSDSSPTFQVVPSTTSPTTLTNVGDVRLCANWTAEPTSDSTAGPVQGVLRRLPAIEEAAVETKPMPIPVPNAPVEETLPAELPTMLVPSIEEPKEEPLVVAEPVGPILTLPPPQVALELPELTLPEADVIVESQQAEAFVEEVRIDDEQKSSEIAKFESAKFARAMERRNATKSAKPELAIDPQQLLSIQLPNDVAVRTRSMLGDATSLANRGARFAARQQFEKIMRITCQALDAQVGRPIHSRALARGLRAIEEAEDFSVHGDSAEIDFQLGGFIEGHSTPVLKDVAPGEITSLLAMQAYYRYAVGELSIAGNNEPISSEALFALGRIEALLSRKTGEIAGGGPKSLAFYHAALAVNPSNGRAANELGVMLARRGRLQEARNVLQYAAASEPAAVANLAKVYGQLGDQGRAMQMMQRVRQIAAQNPSALQHGPAAGVRWVDHRTFANAPGSTEGPPSASPIRSATSNMQLNGNGQTTAAAVFQQNRTSAPPRKRPFGWGR